MSDDDRRAARTIAAILRRGQTDPVITANEILIALRGHGWRPTPATRHQPWQPNPGETLTPDIVHACAAQVREALTEALERAAQTEGPGHE